MSKKKVLIISGSKNDELTAKLLKSFDNYSINYILIDFENFKLFFSLNKSSSNIKKNAYFVTNLKTGIYFVRIKENSNKITTKKLIIN